MTFAAIEVGSYEMELAIYEIGKKGVKVVDRVSHVLGLGVDTYTEGKIRLESLNEICEVLSGFRKVMQTYQTTEYRAYASSAIREAANGIRILDQIQVRTGFKVETISNSEQRFLYYRGFLMKDTELAESLVGDTVLLDIGSGSMQLSVVSQGLIENTQNLRIGSLRLREMFSEIRETTRRKNEMVRELVDSEISTFCRMWLKGRTITNLVGFGDYLDYFAAKVLTGKKAFLTKDELDGYCEQFMGMTPEELAKRYEMQQDKASLLVPCLICYQRAMELSGAARLYVPELSLCDCMAEAYGYEQKIIRCSHNFEDDLLNQARVIAARYQSGKKHGQSLEQNSASLFDALKKYHGLSKRERLLLRLAALLHDCGRFVNMDLSGECSYQILMSTEIIGISHHEREMIANIVRFNCMDEVYDEDLPGTLSEEDYLKVLKLTAILRIANALDRTHKQKLKDLKVTFKNNSMILSVNALSDYGLESGLFEQKADFFEEIYGIRPVLKKQKK